MSADPTPAERYEADVRGRYVNHRKAECIGFFGYGSGREARARHQDAQAMGQRSAFCNECPQKQACWDLLRVKAKEVMPALTEEFERMAQVHRGAALLRAWQAFTGAKVTEYHPDPYMALNLLNMRIGAEHSEEIRA